jgi:inner membrane protein COX18
MLRTQSFKSHQEGIRAISKAVGKETKALNERWACSIRGQIGWTFAQLPIFLVMAEVIRRLCGTKDGLLRMAMNAFGISQPTNPEASVLSNAYATDVATNPWFDPSLTTEGMLWFQDLTAADPMGMLSYIASGLMFINVYGTQNGVTNSETTKGSKRLRRVLLLVSLLIGPMCAQLPAGLLLYWTGSTTSAIVWNQWLDRKYPVITGIQPCKRPLFVIPTANRPSLPTPKPAGR